MYVLSKNKKIIISFYLKFFIFTTVKNRCILHGHVFVMIMVYGIMMMCYKLLRFQI